LVVAGVPSPILACGDFLPREKEEVIVSQLDWACNYSWLWSYISITERKGFLSFMRNNRAAISAGCPRFAVEV
jgi:hypothetical protein